MRFALSSSDFLRPLFEAQPADLTAQARQVEALKAQWLDLVSWRRPARLRWAADDGLLDCLAQARAAR